MQRLDFPTKSQRRFGSSRELRELREGDWGRRKNSEFRRFEFFLRPQYPSRNWRNSRLDLHPRARHPAAFFELKQSDLVRPRRSRNRAARAETTASGSVDGTG